MGWKKGELLYEGKAKKIFSVDGEDEVIWQDFKDTFTAFNGVKKETMAGKGKLNRQIASLIFQKLAENGISSHWLADDGEISMITRKLKMIDLEVVVRNRLAGSTAKKFAIEEGADLDEPLVEFYYKKDELNDPFISDDQAMMLKVVKSSIDLAQLKKMALMVNRVIQKMFDKAGISLVDFKIEFGYDSKGNIVLGDEISPDSCRLWDKVTQEKMDKDRFRRDLGQVLENYQEVLNRISKQ